MATQPKKRQPRRGGASRPGLFSGLLGSREIEKRVDDLLNKISKNGLNSLTPEERSFLQEASKRYRR